MSYADFILSKVSRLEEHIRETAHYFDEYDLMDALNPQPRKIVPAPGKYEPGYETRYKSTPRPTVLPLPLPTRY